MDEMVGKCLPLCGEAVASIIIMLLGRFVAIYKSLASLNPRRTSGQIHEHTSPKIIRTLCRSHEQSLSFVLLNYEPHKSGKGSELGLCTGMLVQLSVV